MTTAPIAANRPAAPNVPNVPSVRRIARSTTLIIVLFTISKLFSLVQRQIILNRFGVSTDYDTFIAANTVPEQIFNLIAGGALGYAFIPVFSDLITRLRGGESQPEAVWRLAANVLNTVLIVVLIVAVVIFFAAPWLVANGVAPGFHEGEAAQTVGLMRVLLLSLIIFSISGLTTSVLQSYQRFFLPALAPILYDFGVLFGAAVLVPRFGIYGLAYGAVLGAAGHFLIQVPGLIAVRARWQPTIDWRDPNLRRIVRLMIPRAIGIVLLNIHLIVAISLASRLITGSGTAYSLGWTLMQLPETLIGTAMGIVIFPTLAALSSARDLAGKRSALSGAWRFILLAAIPVAALIVLIGRQTIGLLVGGAFTASDVDTIYIVLLAFTPGLIVQSSIEVVARSFYADKDTVTPLYIAVLSAVLNMGIDYLVYQTWGVPGLAIANTIATSVELIVLTLILRRRWQGLNDRALWTLAGKTALATVAMSVAIIIAQAIITAIFGDRTFGTLIRALIDLILVALGAGIFIGVALLLNIHEIGDFFRAIRQRGSASTAVL